MVTALRQAEEAGDRSSRCTATRGARTGRQALRGRPSVPVPRAVDLLDQREAAEARRRWCAGSAAEDETDSRARRSCRRCCRLAVLLDHLRSNSSRWRRRRTRDRLSVEAVVARDDAPAGSSSRRPRSRPTSARPLSKRSLRGTGRARGASAEYRGDHSGFATPFASLRFLHARHSARSRGRVLQAVDRAPGTIEAELDQAERRARGYPRPGIAGAAASRAVTKRVAERRPRRKPRCRRR